MTPTVHSLQHHGTRVMLEVQEVVQTCHHQTTETTAEEVAALASGCHKILNRTLCAKKVDAQKMLLPHRDKW
jgi:hypothetical protein